MTLPDLAVDAQAWLRIAYGVLVAASLAHAFPLRRVFFASERFGGYRRSSPLADGIGHPLAIDVVLALWLALAACLVAGVFPVAASLGSLLLARHFFVATRWTSLLRGMGAPGFMLYWLGAAVFLLELTSRRTPSERSLALWVLQVDFALIFLSAGIYKLCSGYASNHGMQLGLANPAWCHGWRFYRRLPLDHVAFRVLNHLAWSTEILAALLMLWPTTRLLGAAVVFASFLVLVTQLRLGFLCETVLACCLLFVGAGTPSQAVPANDAGVVAPGLRVLLLGYVGVLPFVHLGLSWNFYARRRLPGPFQRVLDAYAGFFGIIVWRVFSTDLIDFHVRVSVEDRHGRRRDARTLGWRERWRARHVAESIARASLVTTLRYHPRDGDLFRERLRRYARTVPHGEGDSIVLERVGVAEGRVDAAWRIEPESGAIVETLREGRPSPREPAVASPVFEGARPGSYAPRSA